MHFPDTKAWLCCCALSCLIFASGCAPDAGVLGEPGEEDEEELLPPAGRQLAHDLQITAVTFNQGVAVDLFRDGEVPDELNASIVVGRPGRVRVHVEPGEDRDEGTILGELLLSSPDGDLIFEDEISVTGPSEPSDPETTFDFLLSADLVEEDVRVAVRLWETDDSESGGSSSGAAWPSLGSEPLRATSWGGVLRLELVPIEYQADGSGRLPDTSPEQLEVLEAQLMRLFPLRELEVTVREPLSSDVALDADGTGFSTLLEALSAARVEWDIPFDTQVFGLVVPAASHQDFCGFGCTAGLAYRVSNPLNGAIKVGVGLGYSGSPAARTLTHELGHVHDRAHAPCGNAGNPDENFPHAGGGIGVEGWDILDEEWIDPDERADVMGYCTPDWISDYNYEAIHYRMAAVEGLRAERQELKKEPWITLRVAGDGSVSKPRRAEFGFEPEGEPRSVALLDDAGVEVGRVVGHLVRFSDLPGGTLIVPSPAASVAALGLKDQPPVLLPPRGP